MENESKVNNILTEIIETEKTYFENLNNCLIKILEPIQADKLMAEEDINIIFGYLRPIVILSKELEERWRGFDGEVMVRAKNISADLVKKAFFFKIYIEYITNYMKALQKFNEISKKNLKLMEFLQSISKQIENKNLFDLLIMPVQRLPRYKLLFNELKKVTNLEEVNQAYEKIVETTRIVDLACSQAEVAQKFFEIQKSFVNIKFDLIEPHRKFIREGNVRRVIKNEYQSGKFYLFSDLMLVGFKDVLKEVLAISIAEPVKSKFIQYRVIGLCCISKLDIQSNNLIIRTKRRRISNLTEKEYVFQTDSPKETVDWKELIEQCMKEENQKPNHSPLATQVITTDISPYLPYIIAGVLSLVIILTLIFLYFGRMLHQFLNLSTPHIILLFMILILIISIIVYFI